MSLFFANSFASSFAGVTSMQSQGTITTGDASPAGIGTGISIVNGVYRSKILDTDTQTASGIRSELVFAANALGNDEFIDFEFLINASEWSTAGTNNGRVVVFQVHNLDSINAAVNFLLFIENNMFQVWTPSTEPPTEGATYIARTIAPVVFGAWTRISLRVRWVNASTGYWDLFINRAPVYRRSSRGTAYASDTPYPKLGIYASGSTGFGSRTAYYRNFAHYRGAAESFTTVMGSLPIRASTNLI